MHVVLVEPQIATNTGGIIRLCANTGAHLHLVRPLGFDLDDTKLKRSGLDYHEYAELSVYDSLADVVDRLDGRWFAFTSSGQRPYTDVDFADDDVLVFGSESDGLGAERVGEFSAENVLTIPMRPDNRSLNLANAVAVVVYEAWRQGGFAGSVLRSTAGLTQETLTSPPFDG